MLLRLVRTHLRPYRGWITAVVLLQFVGTCAALYLPSLNADIIDKGVVFGDTGYIVRHGGLMLAVSLVQIACSIAAVWFAARTAMSQLSSTSCCSAMMTPPIASSGAVTSIVAPIMASICTCWTSLVLRVISVGAPKLPTSRAENMPT